MLCIDFALRFHGSGDQSLRQKFQLQGRAGGFEAGCLPVDFWKLCGNSRRQEAVREDVTEVQRGFENLFNGERQGGLLLDRPDWSVPMISPPLRQRGTWNNTSGGSATSPFANGGNSWPLQQETSSEDYFTVQEDYLDQPHSIARARLAQLNLHLKPLFSAEEDLLRCGHTQCQELLERQKAFLPKYAQIRSCVHSGCGYVSGTANEWRRHVGFGCEFHNEEENRRALAGEWEEGGRCCGV